MGTKRADQEGGSEDLLEKIRRQTRLRIKPEQNAVHALVTRTQSGGDTGRNTPVTQSAVEVQRIQVVLHMTSELHPRNGNGFNLAHANNTAKNVPVVYL